MNNDVLILTDEFGGVQKCRLVASNRECPKCKRKLYFTIGLTTIYEDTDDIKCLFCKTCNDLFSDNDLATEKMTKIVNIKNN